MNRRWTWLLLWTSLLAGVAAGVFDLVLGIEHVWTIRMAATSVAFLLVWVAADFARIRSALARPSTRFGGGALLLVALVGAIDVLGYVLARRNDHTWDMTNDRVWTLSDQSLGVAASLKERIEVRTYFRPGTPEYREFQHLIGLYREHTQQLDVLWLDPLKDVRKAEQDTVTGEQGTAILERADGRLQRIEGKIDEEHFTRALLLLVSGKDHSLCWSLGHGEPDPDDEMSAEGLGSIVLAVEALNYSVRKVEIPVTGIPSDCEALIVARPRTDWQPAEREALAAYLGAGGRTWLMLDAGLTPELSADLDRYGITAPMDIVLDFNQGNLLLGVNDPSMVVLSFDGLAPHLITRDLGAALVLGIARSISYDPTREGLKGIELLRTGAEAWAESTPDIDPPTPDEGVDQIGEIPVMAVVEITDPAVLAVAAGPVPETEGPVAPAARGVPEGWTPKPGGRLAVIGDSDFASNQLMALGNNRDLFLNTLAWLVDEPEQIGERPPEGDRLEVDTLSGIVVALILLLGVPGLLTLGAIATLLRRRML